MSQVPSALDIGWAPVSYSVSVVSLADPKAANESSCGCPNYVRRAHVSLRGKGPFPPWLCVLSGGQRELGDPEGPAALGLLGGEKPCLLRFSDSPRTRVA